MPVRMLALLVARLTFARYLLASICALSSDMALFLMLDHMGAPPLVSAFGGYTGGLLVHWTISIHYVFDINTEYRSGPTHAQRVAFIASALLGLVLTLGIVGGLGIIGIAPTTAKLLSIPISFLTVYAIRKYGIFARA